MECSAACLTSARTWPRCAREKKGGTSPQRGTGGNYLAAHSERARTSPVPQVIAREVQAQQHQWAGRRLRKGEYEETVWFCLEKDSQPRKFCIAANENRWFHLAIMVLILVSSMYMMVRLHAHQHTYYTTPSVCMMVHTTIPLHT